MHRVLQDDNYGHDRLSTNDLVDDVQFGKAVMNPVFHDHILCSALKFWWWFQW